MNIGLVAHDAKKILMQNFAIAYRGILSKHDIYATGTTGRLIEEVTNLSVHKYLAGHLGGEQQLASQIEHNEIDMVIFLRDPLSPKSHEPDVNTVTICVIPIIFLFATNLATAELLVKLRPRRFGGAKCLEKKGWQNEKYNTKIRQIDRIIFSGYIVCFRMRFIRREQLELSPSNANRYCSGKWRCILFGLSFTRYLCDP